MTQRLHVDWTRCRARGLCFELLPELLVADDWGYPLSRTGEARPVVPDGSVADADRAVRECPRMALRLLDESHGAGGRDQREPREPTSGGPPRRMPAPGDRR